jgi:hypothetical protein
MSLQSAIIQTQLRHGFAPLNFPAPSRRSGMLKKFMVATAVAAVLSFSLGLPIVSPFEGGAAFANNGNGGGNGNSGGNGNGNSGGNGNAGSNGNSAKAASANEAAASDLGKMNGALHASINAVLAHIRNGQTANGPVGLLAGLAVADAGVAGAAAALAGLEDKAAAFDALDTAVVAAGFGSVAEYLQAKADGTATAEQIAALDPLVDAVGGTTADGLALAETAPTEAEIAAAEAEIAAAAATVAEAEAAIGAAMNKDGDLATLLGLLRERLVGYEDEIAASLLAPEAVTE